MVYAAIFYANALIFIPELIYKKKYGQYLIAIIISLGCLLVLDRLFFSFFMQGMIYRVWNFFVFNLPFFVFIIVSSAAFRMIRDRVQTEHRMQEKQTENLKTELAFLRSQVSPHFMFNILNNMVSLARKKSDLLEPSLIKLSSLLRYMLYETERRVSLQKEIEYLESYIDLQRQRFGPRLNMNVRLPKLDTNYEIEPMLLIPFVENAFKHGTALVRPPQIEVDLNVDQNILSFSVKNTFDEGPAVPAFAMDTTAPAETVNVSASSLPSANVRTPNTQAANSESDRNSGIGLVNVQRRLELLYPNKHSLLITKQNGWFIASLQIVLS